VRQARRHADISRVCCTNTMKNAIRLKLFNPACRVSVLYKNIVTYGFREEYYTEARQRGGDGVHPLYR
jgi:heterodisulfide reductase subunit A-like polyferredoxin